ncbi:hypothetical protein SVIOM74S_04374 [Streptomyces violarus]
MGGDRTEQLTRRTLGRGGGPLPVLGRTVLLGRRVHEPGQAVGQALERPLAAHGGATVPRAKAAPGY